MEQEMEAKVLLVDDEQDFLETLSSRLEMRGISLAFSGFQALSRVDFTLIGGTVHALTGANGAGKSTLMAVLCGTHDHYEGEICINNQPVTIREPLDAKRLGIHLVQQEVDVALIPGLSIAENIMLDQLAHHIELMIPGEDELVLGIHTQ